jgi:hypothetical protein
MNVIMPVYPDNVHLYYEREAAFGSQASILGLAVLYVLKRPRVPVRFSVQV